jgi:hypothetical protein
MGDIHTDLKEIGPKEDNSIRLAQNRYQWQAHVNTVIDPAGSEKNT